MTCSIRLTVCAVLFAASVSAQSAEILPGEIRRLAAATTVEAMEDAIANLADNAIKAKLAADGKKANRQFLAFRRADVQHGGSSGASGTTSAVSSPLLPAIFGLAFASGSLTRTVSGNTITIEASPAGLVCANGDEAAAVVARDPEACRTLWKRFGVTASFDTSRGDKNPELDSLRAVGNQFTDLTVRGELLNRRLPKPYRDFLARAGAFANSVAAFAATQGPWLTRVKDELAELTNDAGWPPLAEGAKEKQVAETLDELLAELTVSPRLREEWLASLRTAERSDFNRAVVTAEYSYQQPDLTTESIGSDPVIVPKGARPPSVHDARIIYALGLGNSNLDVTANQSVSWFDELRPGMRGRLRDLRTGIEGKFKLREIANYGAPTLSFAGLYVFLNQEPLGLGLTAFNKAKIEERGHIRLFQTKLEFPTANNAMRIPISFSVSNRTELINESDVRGQIGMSFNLDALFVDK